MPQLDVNAWPPQLFWLAITFLVLYFIVSKLVIPRTGGTIEGRKNQIDSDLASAQRFRTDTDNAVAEYEKALAEARSKAANSNFITAGSPNACGDTFERRRSSRTSAQED